MSIRYDMVVSRVKEVSTKLRMLKSEFKDAQRAGKLPGLMEIQTLKDEATMLCTILARRRGRMHISKGHLQMPRTFASFPGKVFRYCEFIPEMTLELQDKYIGDYDAKYEVVNLLGVAGI